ncbi:MAG TPA: helix-turn-helix transcriptional regulator [Xanthobacteraceae bacterium]|jgi:transcriptional regulator with XRE-family HTH domain|nr:helix-turn-helix transcriptional regulator [Xanthobacteraceae bacterium]
MARSLASTRHQALRAFLAAKRKAAGLRQIDVAKRLKRGPRYVSDVETGRKTVGAVELLDWAEAIGFDPREAVKQLAKPKRK